MLDHINGDLLATEGVIAHGCNTQGVMGAGVALAVRNAHPSVYDDYRWQVKHGRFDLGVAMFCATDSTPVTGIYNLGTQPRPGRCADLGAIHTAIANMCRHAERNGIEHISIPLIGAGFGGLRWSDVAPVIETSAAPHPVHLTVVVLPRAERLPITPGDEPF